MTLSCPPVSGAEKRHVCRANYDVVRQMYLHHGHRVKLLLYERTGFWLLLRRLEQDRFVWPRRDQEVIEQTTQ